MTFPQIGKLLLTCLGTFNQLITYFRAVNCQLFSAVHRDSVSAYSSSLEVTFFEIKLENADSFSANSAVLC